jgi:ADP-ribose pyrophosphatase YjhB (NUDIX family)
VDSELNQLLYRWSQAIAGLCKTGLAFTGKTYEAERYEEILKIAAEIELFAQLTEDLKGNVRAFDSIVEDQLLQKFKSEVAEGIPGYVTPKVAVGAVVENDNSEILLIKRADSGVWLYPTGWTEIGYSPAEVVIKEVKEETGILVKPLKLIAVLDGMRMGFTKVPLYSIVFHCKSYGGELACHPLECLDVGWFGKDSLPEPLAGGGKWLELVFNAIQNSDFKVYFDPIRDNVWQFQP